MLQVGFRMFGSPPLDFGDASSLRFSLQICREGEVCGDDSSHRIPVRAASLSEVDEIGQRSALSNDIAHVGEGRRALHLDCVEARLDRKRAKRASLAVEQRRQHRPVVDHDVDLSRGVATVINDLPVADRDVRWEQRPNQLPHK